VNANAAAERRVFAEFMRPTTSHAPPATSGHSARPAATPPRGSRLSGDVPDGRSQAAALRRIPMPVYFPRQIATGSNYCSPNTNNCPVQIPSPSSYPRAYRIHDQHGHAFPAYRMTLVLNSLLGQYYGVEGTTWSDPPLLSHSNETREVGGKQLELFYDGHKLTAVAWRTSHGVYWVSNTLTDDLSNTQMLGIAASLTRG
jgi:hypothetical protein